MIDMQKLFPTSPRVVERKDDFDKPCGYNVQYTIPDSDAYPSHDEIVCFLPDGMTDDFRDIANLIAAAPDLLECLEDHCLYCSDCDFDTDPDQECKFGRALRKVKFYGTNKIISKDQICYISGPMTGYADLNYPAFFAMEKLLRESFGCEVLNPARHPSGLSYDEYMSLAMSDIDRSDAIILLNGWQNSNGAILEFKKANELKLKIIYQEQLSWECV